ncbi:hypothetical protein CONCODRAFT_20789 [Conidiobolus coronatus NRRL 28638]|uniref:Sulfhydryl oxidase n=1 Tax=Conidiobolus coronatus (strain ATCC 28846 / CBS 209.66 / NRRL 28638) TaxID=796925 RepID=A0A137NRB8_CONC2|nr:hypothetical protein CONCODRAFT_20789 [Conidiobolus coronatus NRRL 28638]|eukprot:KXN65316.1 hypothetical protein CONCODRAFT_20789 [Conidiobolus coronatus NRRL 28638]
MIKANKKYLLLILIAIIVIFSLIFSGVFNKHSSESYKQPAINKLNNDLKLEPLRPSSQEVEMGGAIMSELGDPEIKAELGRSAWKLIHTMTARFPIKPSKDEQKALEQWFHLFSRLYPCGQCARHFQGLLVEHPPKVGSREEASTWACEMHNFVNDRLKKPQFDCSKIAEMYKCGCSDEDEVAP